MLGNGKSNTHSEVAIMNQSNEALVSNAAAPVDADTRGAPAPHISNMSIHKSSNVHVGPKIVNVSNTVHSNRVIQGRWLGLELVSPHASRRVRCFILVFFIMTFLVATLALTLYLFYFTAPKPRRLDIGLNESWYLRRHDWQAQPPSFTYVMNMIPLPVHIAMIGHSATRDCKLRLECILLVRAIQRDHLERFSEIGPNFLVGGEEGYVFEGRGANVVGAAMAGWNSKIVSFMFLGDYTHCSPTQSQLDHVDVVLRALVNKGVLHPDYTIFGYCQIKTNTIPPGPNIMKRLSEFPHWSSNNATFCLGKPLH